MECVQHSGVYSRRRSRVSNSRLFRRAFGRRILLSRFGRCQYPTSFVLSNDSALNVLKCVRVRVLLVRVYEYYRCIRGYVFDAVRLAQKPNVSLE